MGGKNKEKNKKQNKISKKAYEMELQRLHFELIKLQEWVKKNWKESGNNF